ncbi:hypothetical protein DINM_022926 [Dirofilaria immitis]|nr:hypothetical protein [Dirofilaria immitis]
MGKTETQEKEEDEERLVSISVESCCIIIPMFYHCLGLLFVVSVSAIPLPEELDYDGKIPNCHDGGKPLLAADVGVHTCDKNCPKGFQCEYRTTDATLRKGVVNISYTKTY